MNVSKGAGRDCIGAARRVVATPSIDPCGKLRRRTPAMHPVAACVIAALVAGHAPSAVAATLPVTSCADDGSAGTLRAVVATAASGDTVDLSGLSCGTITLLAGQVQVHVDDLTIQGSGRDALSIDGNDNGRVFLHDGTGTLTLAAVTITNGHADSAAANPSAALGAAGGCILSKSLTGTKGSVALVDATVTSCKTTVSASNAVNALGGGISANNAISLSNSTLSNNSASGVISGATGKTVYGGGAYAGNGAITVSNSVVSGNRATTGAPTPTPKASGGGIAARRSTTSVTDSVVENNFAGCDTTSSSCSTAYGGGIFSFKSITLSSSIVSGNTAAASGKTLGGGLLLKNGQQNLTVQVSNSTISENRASSANNTGKGGGLYVYYVPLTISNSTISGNSASIGGGVFSEYNTLTVLQSTISGNSALRGGGIYLGHFSYYTSTHPMTVRNSTITANVSATSGGGIVDTHTAYGASTFQSTIIAGNVATPVSNADLVSSKGGIGANNLIVAAQGVTLPADTISADPLLGPLQDNGGPTFTHALLAGSPAIDAGNNAANLDADQRGSGFVRVFGVAADIGAFEAQPTPGVAKSFAPSEIVLRGTVTSALTLTLTNPTDTDATLLDDLVDPLPAPIVVAAPSDAATTCAGGTLEADAGSGSVTLSHGAVIPAGGSCTVTVTVMVGVAGTYTNTIAAGALRTDRGVNADAAIATLTVTPDQPPVASDDSYEVTAGAALKVGAPGLLGNDSDPNGDALTAVLSANPSHGTLWFDANGGFVYLPAPDFNGVDTFTYKANDGTFDSNVATVTITVNPPVAPLPVAQDDFYATAENVPLVVDSPGVLGNDTDPDGGTLTATLVGAPDHGALTLNPDGSFTYTPGLDFVGTDTFTYETRNEQLDSATATVTIFITPGTSDTLFEDGFDGL